MSPRSPPPALVDRAPRRHATVTRTLLLSERCCSRTAALARVLRHAHARAARTWTAHASAKRRARAMRNPAPQIRPAGPLPPGFSHRVRSRPDGTPTGTTSPRTLAGSASGLNSAHLELNLFFFQTSPSGAKFTVISFIFDLHSHVYMLIFNNLRRILLIGFNPWVHVSHLSIIIAKKQKHD